MDKTTIATMNIRPGYLLVIEFSATGGTTYSRETTFEQAAGPGMVAEFSTTKKVDHVELARQSRALINKAYHVLDKHAINTPLGYWCTEASLSGIEEAIKPIQAEAALFNRNARSLGSKRAVEISLFPMMLREDNERAIKRISRDVRERLQEMRDSLHSGDRAAFERAWDGAKNLDLMATGIQADSLRMALDHAKGQKTQMLDALRHGFAQEAIAPLLDLEPIDAAISLFTEPTDTVWTPEAREAIG